MNTDLTKEQLDEAERIYTEQVVSNNEGYDAYVLAGAYWDYGQQLISMARRTLQAEERLGRAVEALRNLYDEQNGPPLERHKERWKMAMDQTFIILSECEDSPKDLPPPLPCAPPAHSDAQPDSVSRLVTDIAQEFNEELERWKAACSRLEKHVHRLTNECLELRSLTLNPESP